MLNSLSSTGETPWRMEKERGMEERYATPALQEFPQLRRLPFLSAQNQRVIADYLAYLRARPYAPAMQEGTIRALKSFAVLMPEARRAALSHDLLQTTASDVDAWIEVAFRHKLAPSTVATRLRVLQGFFAFLRDQGSMAQSPIRLPRHHILVPQDLPRLSFPKTHHRGKSRRSDYSWLRRHSLVMVMKPPDFGQPDHLF